MRDNGKLKGASGWTGLLQKGPQKPRRRGAGAFPPPTKLKPPLGLFCMYSGQ